MNAEAMELRDSNGNPVLQVPHRMLKKLREASITIYRASHASGMHWQASDTNDYLDWSYAIQFEDKPYWFDSELSDLSPLVVAYDPSSLQEEVRNHVESMKTIMEPKPIEQPTTFSGIGEMAKKESVIEEAQEIIYGDREQTYGHPAKNLNHIAEQWSLYLTQKIGIPIVVTSQDVCWMMADLKKCRQMNVNKRDNLVDAIGYVGLIERLDKGKGK